MRKIHIKEIITKWKEEFIDNLQENNNELEINLYLIPREWEERDTISFYELSKPNFDKFNNSILEGEGNNVNVLPNSNFSVIKDIYIKNITDKKEFINADAKYSSNKLIVDLGKENKYFYYLDKNNIIYEGFIEHINGKIDNNFVNSFENKKIEDFLYSFLKKEKYEINNDNITFF